MLWLAEWAGAGEFSLLYGWYDDGEVSNGFLVSA